MIDQVVSKIIRSMLSEMISWSHEHLLFFFPHQGGFLLTQTKKKSKTFADVNTQMFSLESIR